MDSVRESAVSEHYVLICINLTLNVTEHQTSYLSSLEVGRDIYRGADKSLAQPGRKQATATEDFEFHVSYL